MNSPKNWLKTVKHFIFDLDGTLILGNNVLPFAHECLKKLDELNIGYTIVTNNSSRSMDNYFRLLNFLGFSVVHSQIHTSGKATAQYLISLKKNPSVYLLGTRALVEDFSSHGIACVGEIDAEPIDFVVLGFDQEITYKRIQDASILIRRGIPFIATHSDINIPTEKGLLPDCGSMIALFEKSTEISPKIIGKPNIEMIEPILKQHKLKPEEMVVIGDRLYTDMEMGFRAGTKTILVHTGESNSAMAKSYPNQPDWQIKNLEELYQVLIEL